MSKLSVKKPFTVLVMVVIMVVLGVVSVTRMQMDLLPEISLPYIIVITTYPGASPEKIESQICEPMESSLGTITGVKNISSTSSENYGLVQLEFVDDTDMDSAIVKISSALDAIEDYLPEDAGTPTIMEISMDMMATQYLAVAYEGMSIEELSDFAEDNVIPMFERQDGVASVSSMGLVDKTVQIELNPTKVDDLNNRILASTDEAFAKALEQLDDAKKQLEDSEDSLAENKQKLVDSEADLKDAEQELADGKQELIDGQKELDENKQKLANSRADIDKGKLDLENGKKEYDNQKYATEQKLAETETQLLTAKSDLEATKMHLTTEIATLEATNKAYNEALSSASSGINTAVSGCDQAKSGIEQMTTAVNTALTAMALPTLTDSNTLADLNTAVSTYLPPGTPTINIADINLLLSKAGRDIKTDQYTLGEIKSSLSLAKEDYQNKIAPTKQAVAANEAMIAGYKASLTEVDTGLTQVNDGLTQLYAGNLEAAIQLSNAATQIAMGEAQLASAEAQIDSGEEQLKAAQEQIDSGWEQLEDGQKQIDDGYTQIREGWDQLKDGQKQIDDGWEQYNDSVATFEKQKVETLRHANSDQLLTLSTLAQLIYAQNFEMPAGYIDDKDDNSWLLKVGENFSSLEDIEEMVLCNIQDVGDVKLKDVANVTVIDNALDSYARLGSDQAVILSVFKSSTAGTNEVSRTCKSVIKALEKQYPGLDILTVMDQGDYINIIIKSLLQSMILGALLAVIILALFLRDVRPTVVVAMSIPLSVLTALIALYFSHISLNMLSLSGLSLGIGMLVDNSIVVMENIYRLRGKGVEAPRASVQGANQVTGSIIASTLTTVAVFLPLVFTTGMINDLMMPMALSIIFCLMASLLVSVTLIPATCSTLLRKATPKEHKFFDKVQDAYGTALGFCLKVKIVPLAVAIGLLVLSIWQIMRMGIVMIPEMTSNEMQMTLTLNKEMTKEECFEIADEALDKILEVEAIGSVGVMCGGDTTLFLADSGVDTDYTKYQYMLVMDDKDAGESEVKQAVADIQKGMDTLDLEAKGCEYNISSSMMDTSLLTGSGLSINVYGPELDELTRISEDVIDIVDDYEGFDEISNGQEVPDQVIHLTIDKNKAMSMGLSVAQIYAGISDKIADEKSAITVNIDGEEMKVVVVTHIDELTYENLLDYTFEVSEVDEDDGNTYTHDVTLGEIAKEQFEDGVETINRYNQSRFITVSASVLEGYNVTLLAREIEPEIQEYEKTLPEGYTINITGEYETVLTMIKDMVLVLALGALLIYLVMVAQFQSLLSPFIVIFTVPLAFTGGLIGLWIAGENLSMMGLMGFVLLLGTVVNNGIVFVDYVNQLRKGGLDRHTALIATGKTRMRPILMTALTTILAMSAMIWGDDMGSQMGKGMAIVVAGGLLYATLMTLFIIPVMYDILFKKQPLDVDLGSESLDDIPDDAADYIQSMDSSVLGEKNNAKKKRKRRKTTKKND